MKNVFILLVLLFIFFQTIAQEKHKICNEKGYSNYRLWMNNKSLKERVPNKKDRNRLHDCFEAHYSQELDSIKKVTIDKQRILLLKQKAEQEWSKIKTFYDDKFLTNAIVENDLTQLENFG